MPNFDLQSIEQFRSVGTVFHETSMPSTSDAAKQTLLTDPAIKLPLLVLCDHQTAGRGQPGKSWESNTQSLTFTWCVAANSVPKEIHGLLPLIAGASVCEAIDSIGIDGSKLKWPNDVLIYQKKVCGILVEKISVGDDAYFLFGIGINVNQTAAEIAAIGALDSSFPPSSLQASLGKQIQLQNLLENVLRHLHENAAAKINWAQRLNDRFEFLGEPVSFTKPDGVIVSGTFHGVDDSGRIKIEVEGTTQLFTSGQVSPLQL